MPLYIKDPEVSGLAEDAVKYLGAANKTEAVRQALKAAIAEARAKVPIEERIKEAQALADKLGPYDPTYDHKADMDDLWGM
jgi:antitoxin VapB